MFRTDINDLQIDISPPLLNNSIVIEESKEEEVENTDEWKQFNAYLTNPISNPLPQIKKKRKSKTNNNNKLFTTNPLKDPICPIKCPTCNDIFYNIQTHHVFKKNKCVYSRKSISSSVYLTKLYSITYRNTINKDVEMYDIFNINLDYAASYSQTIIFTCPICLNEESEDPVILHCKHCLCLSCYDQLQNSRCPVCRSVII